MQTLVGIPNGDVLDDRMTPSSDSVYDERVSVTITEMKSGDLHVVAVCPRCSLLRERFIPNGPDDARGRAYLIATEALAEAGCKHVDAVTVTRRKALTTPPERMPAPSAFVLEQLASAIEDLAVSGGVVSALR